MTDQYSGQPPTLDELNAQGPPSGGSAPPTLDELNAQGAPDTQRPPTLDELNEQGPPRPQGEPQAEGPFATLFGHAARSVIPSAASFAGMIPGAAAGAEIGTAIMPGPGTIVGGLIGMGAGSYLAGKPAADIQQSVLGPEDAAQQAANRRANPISANVGEFLPALATFQVGNIGEKIAQRLLMGVGGAGLDIAQQKASGNENIDWTEVGVQGLGMAALNRPREWAQPMATKAEQFGARMGGRAVAAGQKYFPGRPDLSDAMAGGAEAAAAKADKDAAQGPFIPATSSNRGASSPAPGPSTEERPFTGFKQETTGDSSIDQSKAAENREATTANMVSGQHEDPDIAAAMEKAGYDTTPPEAAPTQRGPELDAQFPRVQNPGQVTPPGTPPPAPPAPQGGLRSADWYRQMAAEPEAAKPPEPAPTQQPPRQFTPPSTDSPQFAAAYPDHPMTKGLEAVRAKQEVVPPAAEKAVAISRNASTRKRMAAGEVPPAPSVKSFMERELARSPIAEVPKEKPNSTIASDRATKALRATNDPELIKEAEKIEAMPEGRGKELYATQQWNAMHSATGEPSRDTRMRNPENKAKYMVEHPHMEPTQTTSISKAIMYNKIHDINEQIHKDPALQPPETSESGLGSTEKIRIRAQKILDASRVLAKREANKMLKDAEDPDLSKIEQGQIRKAALNLGNGKLPVENYTMNGLEKPASWRMQQHALDFVNGKFRDTEGNKLSAAEAAQTFVANERLIRGSKEDYATFARDNRDAAETAKKPAGKSETGDLTEAKVARGPDPNIIGRIMAAEGDEGGSLGGPDKFGRRDLTDEQLVNDKVAEAFVRDMRVAKNTKIVEAIENAKTPELRDQLVEHFKDFLKAGGDPQALRWESRHGKRDRNNEVIADREGGMKIAEVAAKHGITPARVQQILGKAKSVEENNARVAADRAAGKVEVPDMTRDELLAELKDRGEFVRSQTPTHMLREQVWNGRQETAPQKASRERMQDFIAKGNAYKKMQGMSRKRTPPPKDALKTSDLEPAVAKINKMRQDELESVAKAMAAPVSDPFLAKELKRSGQPILPLAENKSVPPTEAAVENLQAATPDFIAKEKARGEAREKRMSMTAEQFKDQTDRQIIESDAALDNFNESTAADIAQLGKEHPELNTPEAYAANHALLTGDKAAWDKVPAALQNSIITYISPMTRATDIMFKNSKRLSPGDVGEEAPGNARILINDPTITQTTGPHGTASKANPIIGFSVGAAKGTLKSRAFVELRDLKDASAEPQVITPQPGKGFIKWNDGKGTLYKAPDFDFKNERTYIDNEGRTWEMGHTTEDLIEKHGMLENGEKPQYARNVLLSTFARMKDAAEYAHAHQFFKQLTENNPLWDKYATTNAKDPRVEPGNWEKMADNSPLKYLQGWYMDPMLKAMFDDYVRPGFQGDKHWHKLQQLSQGVTSTLFLFPTIHAMNIVGWGAVERGAAWGMPEAYGRLFEQSNKAIKSTLAHDADYFKMKEAGLSLMGGAPRNQLVELGKELGVEIKRHSRPFELMAKLTGEKPAAFMKAVYAKSADVLWSSDDMVKIQAVHERLAQKGLTLDTATPDQLRAAIDQVHKLIPSYRIGTHFGGKGDFGRTMAKVFSDPAIMAFGRYHALVVRAFAHLGDKIVRGTGQERTDALAQLAVMGVLGMVIKPYVLDPFARMVTGNKDAEIKPFGPLTIPTNIYRATQGKDISTAAHDVAAISPLFTTAFRGISNQSFTGKPIVQPADIQRASHGSTTAAGRAALSAADFAARGLIAPLNQAEQGGWRMPIDQALAISNPTDAAVKYNRLINKHNTQAEKASIKSNMRRGGVMGLYDKATH